MRKSVSGFVASGKTAKRVQPEKSHVGETEAVKGAPERGAAGPGRLERAPGGTQGKECWSAGAGARGPVGGKLPGAEREDGCPAGSRPEAAVAATRRGPQGGTAKHRRGGSPVKGVAAGTEGKEGTVAAGPGSGACWERGPASARTRGDSHVRPLGSRSFAGRGGAAEAGHS